MKLFKLLMLAAAVTAGLPAQTVYVPVNAPYAQSLVIATKNAHPELQKLGLHAMPPGEHVYATIRGHDSVSVFAADARTGRLKFLQNVPSRGKGPRGLGVDPTGRWLLAGNQNTDNVAEFAINPQTGLLSPIGQELKIGSPVDVKFVERAE